MAFNPKPAASMSTVEILNEMEELNAKWDDFHRDLEGMSGSPGEWMVERMDELQYVLKQRQDGVISGILGRSG